MFKMLSIQRILTVTVLLLFNLHGVITLRNLSLSRVVIEAVYEEEYQLAINNTVEYVFLYRTNNKEWMDSTRIEVESNATHDLPLIVVVRQKKGILSWQIPLVVDSMHFNDVAYNKTSRTLCSTKDYQNKQGDEQEEFVTVSLYTASHKNVSFKLNVTQDTQFYLRTGEKRLMEISPSEPIYYGYTFQEQVESSSVIVHVESESDICMTVSIQNISVNRFCYISIIICRYSRMFFIQVFITCSLTLLFTL
ncbi:SID1 transmembrane family member 1-like [Hylaeus anthracinus]|uniref:SID1 transmembrane family member 1-like n=1 Tax=Hylaeus anthracinus TaxID=313031 RepID=UPI0023B8A345|nr:SID1 transmembrane family member 1-like [Hylaeus anthracinus]